MKIILSNFVLMPFLFMSCVQTKASPTLEYKNIDTIIHYTMFESKFNIVPFKIPIKNIDFKYALNNNIKITQYNDSISIYPIDTGSAYLYLFDKVDTFAKVKIIIHTSPKYDTFSNWIKSNDTHNIFSYPKSECEQFAMNTWVNKKLPKFHLQGLEKQYIYDTDIQSKGISLIILWRFGCGASEALINDIPKIKKEMGDELTIYSFYRDSAYIKNNKPYISFRNPILTKDGFIFEDAYEKLPKLFQPIAFNAKKIYDQFYIKGDPSYLIVDKKGVILNFDIGYSDHKTTERFLIEQLKLATKRSD